MLSQETETISREMQMISLNVMITVCMLKVGWMDGVLGLHCKDILSWGQPVLMRWILMYSDEYPC